MKILTVTLAVTFLGLACQSDIEPPLAPVLTEVACPQQEAVLRSCQKDPIIAICGEQYHYNIHVCGLAYEDATWRWQWCRENTPGHWLGSECPGVVCVYQLESSPRLCPVI
jgi:hypothetical protein